MLINKSMNKYLDLSPEVAAALNTGKPVVALESTIISHGMPYPQNVETALRVENEILYFRNRTVQRDRLGPYLLRQ